MSSPRHRTVVETLHATSLLICAAAGVLAAPVSEPAERAPDYPRALERAQLTGRDLVVFQHGSDWNRLGERLLADAWNPPAFAAALGTNVILVVVDQPQVVGNPPVAGRVDPDALPVYETPVSPVTRLRAATDEALPLPGNEITVVVTSNRSAFAADSNGTFIATGENPAHEVITCTLKPRSGGTLLRLDFPLHDAFPGRGPGRASNGNFALSEVEVLDADGATQRLTAAWANASEGAWGPWKAIDGVTDQNDSVWNAHGHLHRPRTLLLVLERPVPAGATLSVRISCRSQWGQHVPGTLRACLLEDPALATDVRQVGQAEEQHARNGKFTWRGDDVPRIAYLDREGRPVTSEDRPRLGLTPATLARRVLEMRSLRVQRDELWARADAAQGPQRAELLVQSLDLLQLGGWPGHENCYKFIHDQIRAADSNDVSGAVRWLEFQTEPRQMPALVNPAHKLAGEKKYAEAIALLDAELKKPNNRLLTTDHRQRILMAKHNIYQQWPDHDAERLQVLRDIVALDPQTYLGIGAAGYLAMFHKNPEPFALSYGWATNHVRAGVNTWNFGAGTTNHFDHAGRYTLRVIHGGGKGTLKIVRAALVAGGTTLSEAAPAAEIKPGGKVEIPLALPIWPPPGPLVLRLESEAAPDQTDVAGRFEVDPLLSE